MSTKSLLKSAGIISAATVISRVLGFIRDILIAGYFGTGNAIQAFIVAFRIPNLLRRLVAEGASSSAFVPVLSEYLVTKDKKEYWRLVNVLLNIVLMVLMVIVIIGTIIAPIIVRVVAPGFARDPAQFMLAVRLTRIIFPYVLLIGLTAYAIGVLNSLKHFSAPAFAPALLNIVIISTILLYRKSPDINTIAYAVLIGGIFQLLVQIPVLRSMGMRIKFPGTLLHPAAKKVLKLFFPRVLGAAVYQLNVLVDTILSSLYWIVGTGGIAALYYSNRLIQLPTAVFGISLATAILPTLSGQFAKKEITGFKDTLNFSFRALFIIMIPAAIGIMVLGRDIVRILFERGEFTAYSTMITGQALFFYSIGLFSYAGIKILVFSFYSMQDTRTPVKTAAAALVVNIVLNLILMRPLKIGGLALATSIAGVCNFSILFYLLRKRIGSFGEKDIMLFFFKAVASACLMGAGLYFWKNVFGIGTASLAGYVIGGALLYFLTLYILKVRELGRFTKWILRIR